MTRMLILACSATKRPVPGPVPAAELYDGPAYRVIRRSPPADVVLMLSAEHGLLPADALISTCDRRMDRARAAHFMTDPAARAAAATTIAHATAGREITEICCFGGKDYACVVRDYSRTGLLPAPVAWDNRGIGHKLGTLKRWLEAPA